MTCEYPKCEKKARFGMLVGPYIRLCGEHNTMICDTVNYNLECLKIKWQWYKIIFNTSQYKKKATSYLF